jgi:hypothetical protein
LIKDIFSKKSDLREIQAINPLSSAQVPFSVGYAGQPADTEQLLEIADSHRQAGRLDDAEAAYRAILRAQPLNPEANYNLGSLLVQSSQPQAALPLLQTALDMNSSNGQYRLNLAACQVQLQAWDKAEALLHNAEEKGMELPLVTNLLCQIAAGKRFAGYNYLDWLNWLHLAVKPKTYVEIGVESGQSLQFSKCKSVGIDPAIQIFYSQESWVKLYKLTSDDFFVQHDLRKVLGAEFVDMAFIDGLHTFDQALKDFINIERHAHSATVVVFHDIFPVTAITASRERKSFFWLGDTWKVVLILKEMRPDLKICTLPAFPSGLTLVTGLNGNSKLLSQEVDQIIERWMKVELDSYLPEMDTHLNVIENDTGAVSKFLRIV